MKIEKVLEMKLPEGAGQFKIMPARLGDGKNAFVAFYSGCYDVDVNYAMFVLPTDTLHGICFTADGRVLWKVEMGILPSAALYNFTLIDLDGDGRDELYIVNNSDPVHPFWVEAFALERRDVLTGEVTGSWKWPNYGGIERSMWYFRNHLFAGYDHGVPVLVAAQGTYQDMYFQAYGKDMKPLWTKTIGKNDPGARGSHSFPIVDIDGDGVDEVLWGERCISLHDGHELFCIEKDTWNGHSDMCQPVHDVMNDKWYVYINRESDEQIPPRIGLYDETGRPVWTDVAWGHIHKGWVGTIGEHGELIANGMRITGQRKDATGRYYTGITEFVYEALTGKPIKMGFSLFDTAPIDIDGDGREEILRGVAAGDTVLLDQKGKELYHFGGKVAMNAKILDAPGEQVMVYDQNGIVRLYRDAEAVDSDELRRRIAEPVYQRNLYARNIENNICMLGAV